MYENDAKFLAAIPAVGYFIHWIDDGQLFGREPIVAFLIFRHSTHDGLGFYLSIGPMTATGTAWPDGEYAIEWPNGGIEFPEDRNFDNIGEAQAYLSSGRSGR